MSRQTGPFIPGLKAQGFLAPSCNLDCQRLALVCPGKKFRHRSVVIHDTSQHFGLQIFHQNFGVLWSYPNKKRWPLIPPNASASSGVEQQRFQGKETLS